MRLVLTLIFMSLFPGGSVADCVCRCVDGEMQAICEDVLDIAPFCPMRHCPLEPLELKPLPSLRLPPLLTKRCEHKQVLNPRTKQYEWRELCS